MARRGVVTTQVIEESTRRGTVLYLILAKKEEVVKDMKAVSLAAVTMR